MKARRWNGWRTTIWKLPPPNCHRCGERITSQYVWIFPGTANLLHYRCGPGLPDGTAPSYTPAFEVARVRNSEGNTAVEQYRVIR